MVDDRKELEEKLKKMSPAEIKELVKKQCIFCKIVYGEIKAARIYEDTEVVGILEIRPASIGHVLVFPKRHFQFLEEVPDDLVEKLFVVVNKINKNLIKNLNAEGINIIVNNGQVGGQVVPHVIINVIPRYKDDKLSFDFERKEINEEELEKLKERLMIKEEKMEKKPEVLKYRFKRIP